MTLSVVIPTLNEAPRIRELLRQLLNESPTPEIIVADGGSEDETRTIAAPFADHVLQTAPGRGGQLNAGTKQASGEILWFVHADSIITSGSIQQILDVFCRKPELVGGAFRLKFDVSTFSMRLIASGANLRSILFRQPWGDQGIFVLRDIFHQLGGFPDWPIMEDLEFMKRLTKRGSITILKTPIMTSARRYQKLGTLSAVALNFRTVWWFARGYSIDEIRDRFRPLHEQGGGANRAA